MPDNKTVTFGGHTLEAVTEPDVGIKRLTLAEYAHKKGLTFTDAVDGHIHAGLRSAPTSKKYRRWYMSELARLQDLRDKTVDMYRAAVDRGEVINPEASRIERLMKTANGHPDNPSVQAARRIIKRMGYGNACPERAVAEDLSNGN